MGSQQLPTFTPSGTGQAITGIIYYILVIIVVFLSMMSIYALIRHGKSKGLALVVSVVYLIFVFSLLNQGISILKTVK